MRFSPRYLLGLLSATALIGAVMVPLPAFAGITGPTLTIAKDCAGLPGTATLHLVVTRPGLESPETVGSFDVRVECGKSQIVFGIPGEGLMLFQSGETITITEATGPSLAILAAAQVSVTLGTDAKSVSVVDPAAVSIKKTCAAGVTGTATFKVSNSSEQASINVQVPCGTTVAVPLPNTWDTDEDLVIHESTPPTNGVAAADVTVTIPDSSGTPQLATFANALVATPVPSTTPAPTPAVLPATGYSQVPPSQAPFVLAATATGALLVLFGFGLWRRRRA
jgi:hypothetical protein